MNKVKIYDTSNIQDLSRADIGSAGVDIRSNANVTLLPKQRTLIKTGLHMELPIGMEFQIRSRSGLALKNGISVLNSPGTVDATYRGEVGVILYNSGDEPYTILIGDRIAQGVFALYESPIIEKVESLEELSETDRGESGFGGSGIK